MPGGALTLGHRGLPNGGSLMKLLAQHRGYPHRNYLARLKVKELLGWVDADKELRELAWAVFRKCRGGTGRNLERD
jgi:hypothetical protein